MREIKFQFIIDNKYLSKSYTVEEILNTYDEAILEDLEVCNCVLTESSPSCEGDCCKFLDSTITGKRRFIGLLDKNGKEIYEGDKYKNKYGNIKIIEYHETFSSNDMGDCYYGIGFEFSENESCDSIEIIGNIYEN